MENIPGGDAKLRVFVRSAFFFVIVLVFFLSAILGCVLLILLLSVRRRNGDIPIKGHSYKYYKLNPSTNDSYLGIVSLSNDRIIDDFKSYEDSSGNSVLISKFGYEHYRCSGVCYCEDENIRRISHAPLVQKGLVFLVASISSLVVMSVAREYFREECINRFSREEDSDFRCKSPHSVKSEVEGCVPAVEEKENTNDATTESKRKLQKTYHCVGYCQTVDFLQQALNLETGGIITEWTDEQIQTLEELEAYSGSFECEKIEYTRDISVEFNERMLDYIDASTESGLMPSELYGRLEIVKSTFAKKYLNGFCLKSSLVEKTVTKAARGTGVCCGYQENYSIPPSVVCLEK